MKKKGLFGFLIILALSVFLTGCLSSGFIRQPRYEQKMEEFKQAGDKTMNFFIDHFEQHPFQVMEEEGDPIKIGVWKLYSGGGTVIGNTTRGRLSGRRIYTESYVDTSHGCTIYLKFDKRKGGVMTDYVVTKCR